MVVINVQRSEHFRLVFTANSTETFLNLEETIKLAEFDTVFVSDFRGLTTTSPFRVKFSAFSFPKHRLIRSFRHS